MPGLPGEVVPGSAYTTQFVVVAQLRVTDQAVYNQIKADYGLTDLGVDALGAGYWATIQGVAPQVLMTRYSIPISLTVSQVPGMLFGDSALLFGVLPSIDASGTQTLTQAYTDANGQVFTEITWEWVVSVERFPPSVFSQQVVTWAGNDVAARLIPTTIDLTVGQSAVWIFSDGGAPVLATSAMLALGKHATYSIDPASTTLGVMTMGSTGFTVTTGASVDVNRTGFNYTAIVWNDTLGAKMQTGSYTGGWNGAPPHDGSLDVPTAFTGDPISFGFITGGVQATIPDGVFLDAGYGIALNISTAEAYPLSNVASLGTTLFTVAPSGSLNTLGHVYYYIMFAIPAIDPIRTSLFQTWTKVGTAGADTVTGLIFTPSFALARTYEYPTFTAAWRGPADAGTISHGTITGASLASGGIESVGVGTLGLGATVSPNGITIYGFALAGGTVSSAIPTWTSTVIVDNGDGTTSLIETSQQAQQSPGNGWTYQGGAPVFRWWCHAVLGRSVYQIDSPGTGWAACSGPASDNGWYLSTAAFGNQDTIVSAGKPADPRPWAKLSTWTAIGNMSVFGGSPSACCTLNNNMVYPASGYTVGTDYPPIRVFNGRQDRELCRLPPTTANVIPKAVMSMLAANGTVYLSTWDSGTTSADWAGRVFSLNPETGVLTSLGTVFAAGEMPYALAWHMGRLWCGTNNSIGTVGKVYFFRPGIDTTWTSDYSLATSTAGGVTSMASYGGKLYVGTDNAAASRGKVLVRDTAGAYTTSQTGTGGTARVNNGYLALTVLGANLYASYWNKDTTVISKIEKYTGSAWSTAYTGATTTLVPYVQLQLDNNEIYALGGSVPYDAALLVTADGTTWTNLSAELPEETITLLPMFGAVVP